MPKRYTKRTDSTDVELRNICECGHADYMHKGYKFDNSLTECKTCLCPKYKFEQKLTIEQEIELDIHLLREATRLGDVQ